MKLAAIRKKRLAIRNACLIGASLVTLLLLAGALRHAGPAGTAIYSALAGLSLTCLLIARHLIATGQDADAAVRSVPDESGQRMTPFVAMPSSAANRYIETLDRMLAGCQLIGFDWRYLYVNDAVARHGRKEKRELIGRTMMECYPGIEHTPMFAVLQRCMEERSLEHMENEFVHADGTPGWFELSVQPVPEGIFVVSIEITERKQAETNMRRQLERLRTLRAIDLAILGTTDLPLTLRTILEEARARLRVDGVDIRLFNPSTSMLDVVASSGSAGGPGVRLGDGTVGIAAHERRTVAIPDAAADDLPRLADAPAPASVRAVYTTALVAKDVLIGTFTVSFCAPFHADREWIDFFETIAGQAAMAIESGRLFDERQRAYMDLRLAYDTTIEGWSRALDLRDKETEGHTQRVTELTVKLAHEAGMSEAEIVHVRRGALLHDIGKMGVPDHILLKPDQLTDDEWRIMRKHPTYAYELLRPIEYLREALDIPYCHHEKWDGTGYPRGLKGEQIPLAARLFAVVDVWDAIRSDRPYRRGWDEEKALEYIRSVSGTHLDPRAVGWFLRVHGESTPHHPEKQLAER